MRLMSLCVWKELCVPFKSQAQRAFMYSQHPAIARRWEKLTPKNRDLPRHDHSESESEESNKPGVPRLPRKSGLKRDFGVLHPGPKARLKLSHAATEEDSMEEKRTEAHTKGERGKMSLKYHNESRLQGRDIRNAERSRNG